jgi:hypothetical protein
MNIDIFDAWSAGGSPPAPCRSGGRASQAVPQTRASSATRSASRTPPALAPTTSCAGDVQHQRGPVLDRVGRRGRRRQRDPDGHGQGQRKTARSGTGAPTTQPGPRGVPRASAPLDPAAAAPPGGRRPLAIGDEVFAAVMKVTRGRRGAARAVRDPTTPARGHLKVAHFTLQKFLRSRRRRCPGPRSSASSRALADRGRPVRGDSTGFHGGLRPLVLPERTASCARTRGQLHMVGTVTHAVTSALDVRGRLPAAPRVARADACPPRRP